MMRRWAARLVTRGSRKRQRHLGKHHQNQHQATFSSKDTAASMSSIWNRLKGLGQTSTTVSSHISTQKQQSRARPRIADVAASPKHSSSTSADVGLPNWLTPWDKEFQKTHPDSRGWEASVRIARIAVNGFLEPSAVALLAASTSAVLAIGAFEGYILCATEMPHSAFVLRYSVEQLLPSCLWSTQDASLVATAMGLDPSEVLQKLDPTVPADAQMLLRVQTLAAARSMAAGFMLLAQLVRVGTIGADAPNVYMERIRQGREPPMLSSPLIVRLCGRDSDATTTSLHRMGRHLLPVYEEPDRVAHLAQGKRFPVYWCVRPGRYGYAHWWRDFPVDQRCLIRSSTGRKVLVMEADATNSRDPLALGDRSLDLTLDDASQGFRRIEELFARHRRERMPPFRTLRVFLGNSLEISKSGGGHSYTLRHRVRFAKEVDVLIDSRAPVLQEILQWCDRVADKDRRILFQTSSQQYFMNLRLLMRNYGYSIYDPLDWHMLEGMEAVEDVEANGEEAAADYESLLQVLVDEQFMDYGRAGEMSLGSEKPKLGDDKAMRHQLRQITKLSRLPRIVYYGNTPETVNAVQALVNAGEVEVANCCAILDKEDGLNFLTEVFDEQASEATSEESTKTSENPRQARKSRQMSGLHIVCSSTIYDDLFRQVRQWTRMGHTGKEIQTELDARFEKILQQTREVKEIISDAMVEEEVAHSESPPDTESFEDTTDVPPADSEEESDTKPKS